MNIFFLDPDPEVCAKEHLDKHVVKMIIEYAQLMSTAHRILDGVPTTEKVNGRNLKRWKLSDDREAILYKASHFNHPSAIWVRNSQKNYAWLFSMWRHLLREYTFRYGKIHSSERLLFALSKAPKNISNDSWTQPTPAMPFECKVFNGQEIDSMLSYRNYYLQKKSHFAKWTKREMPVWYAKGSVILEMLKTIQNDV
jgi:hypothetical protein